ncbi:uncharacterized protein LOC129915247 [Episyrphus balteatus]|uniref:uncharacterized protein LOC129915247 n=1 Tax=Episyrphus balteatus TaxID=286459 RepID=UPI00248594B7|nr:uncharacterized protein LOC129915247 [Episyrphus balteatus]
MEVTPKLPRKSLSLTSRLRNPSSASPSPKHHLRRSIDPSSPISIPNDGGVEGTPPHRKFTFNFPYSPSNDVDFSPRSMLSQSSNNSPDVTWKWTQDDQSTETTIKSRSTPNSTNIKELRKKRSVERKEELRKAELEKRKAIKTKREDVIKKQCEQMELIISKKCAETTKSFVDKDFVENKKRLSTDSSGFGSKGKEEDDLFDDSAFDGILERVDTDLVSKPSVSLDKKEGSPRTKQIDDVHVSPVASPTTAAKDKDLDLLDDSESEGLLLEASQQVETSIETKTKKKSCTKELERSFEEIPTVDKEEKASNYDFLQDSFDDCFALVDDDIFAAEPKKPRTSLQRYKSMPTESPTSKAPSSNVVKASPDKSKIRRYQSSSTIRPNSKFR